MESDQDIATTVLGFLSTFNEGGGGDAMLACHTRRACRPSGSWLMASNPLAVRIPARRCVGVGYSKGVRWCISERLCRGQAVLGSGCVGVRVLGDL